MATYISYFTVPSSILAGVGSLLAVALSGGQERQNSLSLTATSDAVMTVLTGVAGFLTMARTVNECNSADIILHHAITLLPITNGLVSTTSWNYQCWNELKYEESGGINLVKKLVSFLPQYLTSLVFLMGLWMMSPEKQLVGNKDVHTNCLPSHMLSYTYYESCENMADFNSRHYFYHFNKFLNDINKSRAELFISDNRINFFNDTTAIIDKVYQLVGAKIIDIGQNDAEKFRREPRRITKKERYDQLKNTNIVSNSSENDAIEFNNESIKYISPVTSTLHLNQVTFDNISEEITTISEAQTNGRDTSDTDFHGTGFTNLTSTTTEGPNNKNNSCHFRCFVQDHHEKKLFLVLLLFYLVIPACCAMIFYYKSKMCAMRDSDLSSGHQTLLKFAKWNVILPIIFLAPPFASLFVESMLCPQAPQWVQFMALTSSQVYSLIKNALNILVIKKYMKSKRNCKVHPEIKETVAEEGETSSTEPGLVQEEA